MTGSALVQLGTDPDLGDGALAFVGAGLPAPQFPNTECGDLVLIDTSEGVAVRRAGLIYIGVFEAFAGLLDGGSFGENTNPVGATVPFQFAPG